MKEIKKELIVDEFALAEMEPATMQASANGCSVCSIGSVCLLTPGVPDFEIAGLFGLFGLAPEQKLEKRLAVNEMELYR